MHYELATAQCVSFYVSQLLWQHLSANCYALPTDVTKYSPHEGEEVLSLQAALLLYDFKSSPVSVQKIHLLLLMVE